MITIAFVACVIGSSPELCRDYSLSMYVEQERLTPQQCMKFSQPELAKWVGEHPGWRIARWRCESGNGKSTKA